VLDTMKELDLEQEHRDRAGSAAGELAG